MGKLFWRLQQPVDHPTDMLACFRFQDVARLKERIQHFDCQIGRWNFEREFLERSREMKGGEIEAATGEFGGAASALTQQIEEAEIERANTLFRADAAFREYAEIEIRLLDFTYEALRLEQLLADQSISQHTSLPPLLSQLSTLVSLNNNRTDLFIQLASSLGYDEELGARHEDGDVSLLANDEFDLYQSLRIGDRKFSYIESGAVREVSGDLYVLPETRLLL